MTTTAVLAGVEKPVRVQRKRTKGWKSPENTIYVGRPSKWGNPFVVGVDGNAEEVVELYRKYMSNEISDEMTTWRNSFYGKWEQLKFMSSPWKGFVMVCAGQLEELRGKNLSCFCKEDQPCHADILLKLANSDPAPGGNGNGEREG